MITETMTKYLSTAEVAEYLEVCAATVRTHTKREDDPIPRIKFGPHLWKYPLDEVEAWAKRNAGVTAK